jgi:hypothetical protein
MVYYEGHKQAGMSSGDLWQDSAVSAARLIEKYIHQEEQCLQLSESLSGGTTDYERNSNDGQYIKTETSSDMLPIDVSGKESSFTTGVLAGTSFMYRIRANKLSLYDMLDKSGSRTCQLPSMRNEITAVGVTESRDPASRYFLVVATTFDVSLFYFNPDDISDERPPTLSGYVAATGGVPITAICRPNSTKRVFLGGEDGSVYELIYNSQKPKSEFPRLWSDDRRCYLQVLYRPLISATLPPFFHSIVSSVFPLSGGQVSALQVDPCRQLLFVVSGRSSLSVYNLADRSNIGEISEYTLGESLRAAYRAAGTAVSSEPEQIIEVIPSNPHIGGDVVCVLVTKRGARIFIKGLRYYGSNQQSSCKSCEKFKHYSQPSQVSLVQILTVRLPPVELHVSVADSPDFGRSILMASQEGIAIIRADESSIAQRQQDRSARYRERFELVPVSGDKISVFLLIQDSCDKSFTPVDFLPSVVSDPLLGCMLGSWRALALSAEREVVISPLTTAEQVLELVKSQNLYSIRDFAIQWKPDQLAALLLELLTNLPESIARETVERILFVPDTASALGLIDAPGLGQSPQPSSIGVLGSVVQTQTQNISARTKGLAILISRLLRPVWFKKAFKISAEARGCIVVKPGLSSAQRQYMQLLLKPVTGMLNAYRHKLASVGSEESKLVEGFLVLLNAMAETLELERLIETGQLNASARRKGEDAKSLIQEVSDLLDGTDSLFVRDIAMSAGVGDPVLIELLTRTGEVDFAMAKKHCPLILP